MHPVVYRLPCFLSFLYGMGLKNELWEAWRRMIGPGKGLVRPLRIVGESRLGRASEGARNTKAETNYRMVLGGQTNGCVENLPRSTKHSCLGRCFAVHLWTVFSAILSPFVTLENKTEVDNDAF